MSSHVAGSEQDSDPDLLEILGRFIEYVQNERVRSYNEGVDDERERCARIAESCFDEFSSLPADSAGREIAWAIRKQV